MDDAITRFWDKYIEKTVTYDVTERARMWYVKRVEHFIKAFPDTRLQLISSDDLSDYLKGIGRKSDCHENGTTLHLHTSAFNDSVSTFRYNPPHANPANKRRPPRHTKHTNHPHPSCSPGTPRCRQNHRCTHRPARPAMAGR